MKKRFISMLVFMAMFLGTAFSSTIMPLAAGKNVNISLPNFKVTMNGQVVNNQYSKYPLIVYKDITYFPMTFSDCRFLGIESTWKGDKAGLFIDATGISGAYKPYTTASKNGSRYTATTAAFPIQVNGKTVDNSKEEYPLLLFRDITYFPMTWKYGVGEFGWDYKFDNKNGLTIQSKNAKVDQIAIPLTKEYKENNPIAVMVKNGYVYYIGNKGAVMQAPLSDLSKARKVFELDIWSYGSGKQYTPHSFYEEKGKAFLYFHSGGAVMGSDHRFLLKENGTIQKFQGSYYDTTLIGDKLYMYWMGPTPGPGNLWMKDSSAPAEDDDERLGSNGYWYYPLSDIKGVPKFELIGNELYLRAGEAIKNENDWYDRGDASIYSVNTVTNALTRVSKASDPVMNAQLVGDEIYYVTAKAKNDEEASYKVYKHSLKDGSETLLGGYEGENTYQITFAVVGGKSYYVSHEILYRLGGQGGEKLNENAKVLSIHVTGDQDNYLVATFEETSSTKYRLMVFDQTGKVVFKTADAMESGSTPTVEGRTLYFYSKTTGSLCKTTF